MKGPTTVSLVHLGCARNLIDSELILARMSEEGCRISGGLEGADVAVLNTCSFIGPAREESEEAVRDLLARKRRGEVSAVAVVGCLVQRFQHQLEAQYPEVDLFAEISDYSALARAVRELGEGNEVPRYLAAGGLRSAQHEGARLLSTPRSYAYLRISHGCDHTCSFCAIPSIRGPHRSKPIEVLVEESRELIDYGVRELVLVAEDSTAWGRELGKELPELVEALAELDGEHRLRVMYAYPNRFPWELTRLLRDHPRVLPYLDIPVQHASSQVLRAMRRAGSGDQVRRILDRLLEEVPGLTLRTTLLVGFPGETDQDVDELVELVKDYSLSRLGAFTYSHETGTPAGDMTDDVPAEKKRERWQRVIEARNEVLARVQGEAVGKTVEVLVDEVHQDQLVGRSIEDAPEVDMIASLVGVRAEVGDRIQVRVTGLDEEFNLICESGGSDA